MTNKDLFNQIRRYCQNNADLKVVQKYSRYFKEGYDAYGLSQEIFENGINAMMKDGQIKLKLVLSTARGSLKYLYLTPKINFNKFDNRSDTACRVSNMHGNAVQLQTN